MSLDAIHGRLLEIARERVRSGLVSESGLARASGISQPHLHNVLKNIRTLSTDAADRLMEAMELTVAELLWRHSGGIGEGVRAVPVLKTPLGPGAGPEFGPAAGAYPVPSALLHGVHEPLVARISPDLVLPRMLMPNDLVLLDQNPRLRAAGALPRTGWVVREPAGLRVRYLRRTEEGLFIASEETLPHPQLWQPVAPPEGNILERVRARIVWISREMETPPAGPADPAGPFD